MTREKIANFLTYLCLFLLPWQTVWIYDSLTLAGSSWEYGKLMCYAVQVLILVAVLVRWKIKTSDSIKNVLKSGWLFFGAILFSCIFSVNPYLSFGFSFHVLSALLLFRLLADERILTKKIIWFFVLGLIVPCLLGWWQVFIGVSPGSTLFGLAERTASIPGVAVVETIGGRLMRAYGSFPHPNIFGGWLAVGVLMMLGRGTGRSDSERSFVGARHGAPQRTIRTIFIIFLSATIVITFSRSAWLALIIGIISFFVASGIARKKISRKFLLSLTVASVAFVASAALFHSAIFTRIMATDRLETKSLVERQTEYQMIGEVIKINPFIGVGPGAYTVALAEKFPDHDVWFYQPMHNSILLIFAELGIVGLLFLMRFLWAVAVQFKHRRGEWPFAPTIMIVVAIIILSIFDHYLWSGWAGLSLLVVVLAAVLKNTIESKFSQN